MRGADRRRRIAAVLLVATAVLFVIGVSAEHDNHSEASENVVDQPAGEADEGHVEAEESEEGHAEGEGESPAAEGEEGHDERAEDETVLGVDAESPATVTLAVLASLALAAGLWFTRRRSVATAAAVAAALFMVFDIAEVSHQLDESRTGLAILAVVIAVGHAGAAVLAGSSALARRTETPV